MGSTLLEFENSTWEVLGRNCAKSSYEFLKGKNQKLPKFDTFSEWLKQEFMKARAEVEVSLKEFRFEKLAWDFFYVLGINTADGFFNSFLEAYYKPITDQITLIEGAVSVLRHFKEKGLKIGIVSNTIFPQRFHLRELKRFELLPYLDAYFFSSEVGVRKPHPHIFVKALRELKVNDTQAVFVGDRLIEDVGGAQNVGMKGILKCHEGRDYSAPIIPDAQITELTELPKILSNIL